MAILWVRQSVIKLVAGRENELQNQAKSKGKELESSGTFKLVLK